MKSTKDAVSKKQSSRRPAIDLTIDEYKIGGGEDDREFEQMAIDQMKSFLFAGHETTSSTLCYIYYL